MKRWTKYRTLYAYKCVWHVVLLTNYSWQLVNLRIACVLQFAYDTQLFISMSLPCFVFSSTFHYRFVLLWFTRCFYLSHHILLIVTQALLSATQVGSRNKKKTKTVELFQFILLNRLKWHAINFTFGQLPCLYYWFIIFSMVKIDCCRSSVLNEFNRMYVNQLIGRNQIFFVFLYCFTKIKRTSLAIEK